MTNDERSPPEMRDLLGFARGLGPDEAGVQEIYEAVGPGAAPAVTTVWPRCGGGCSRRR